MRRTSSDSHDRVNAEDSATRSSLVSGSDAAKIFAAAEHALDGVAVAVDVRREAVFPAPIGRPPHAHPARKPATEAGS
jgi:hypothetical protein